MVVGYGGRARFTEFLAQGAGYVTISNTATATQFRYDVGDEVDVGARYHRVRDVEAVQIGLIGQRLQLVGDSAGTADDGGVQTRHGHGGSDVTQRSTTPAGQRRLRGVGVGTADHLI